MTKQLNAKEQLVIGFAIAKMNRAPEIQFLIPYVAKIDKDRNITSLLPFQDTDDYEDLFTPDQVILNAYCEDFVMLLGLDSDNANDRLPTMDAEWIAGKEKITLKFWREIEPMLKEQDYVHYISGCKSINYKKAISKNVLMNYA